MKRLKPNAIIAVPGERGDTFESMLSGSDDFHIVVRTTCYSDLLSEINNADILILADNFVTFDQILEVGRLWGIRKNGPFVLVGQTRELGWLMSSYQRVGYTNYFSDDLPDTSALHILNHFSRYCAWKLERDALADELETVKKWQLKIPQFTTQQAAVLITAFAGVVILLVKGVATVDFVSFVKSYL